MKKRKEIQYRPGRIKALVECVLALVMQNPALMDDMGLLAANIAHKMPGYGNGKICFNCARRMPRLPPEPEQPDLEEWHQKI